MFFVLATLRTRSVLHGHGRMKLPLGQPSIIRLMVNTSKAKRPFFSPSFFVPIVPKDKETAIQACRDCIQHEPKDKTIFLFSDGSKTPGGLGSACVDLSGNDARYHHIGSRKHHTALEAELRGIKLGLEILKEKSGRLLAYIFTDCTQAIGLITGELKSATLQIGEAIVLAEIHTELGSLQRLRPDLTVCLHWIPARNGLEGNLLADKAARQAANPPGSKESNIAHISCAVQTASLTLTHSQAGKS